jgi:DNA-binding transcriptional MerR regulator
MGSHVPIRKHVTTEIPDKLYFRIGDVARLCEVPAYVLRFWETEFAQLKPNKGGTGQRLYRKRDVEIALRIKHLLYDQGYTIPGARQVFKDEAKPRETTVVVPVEAAAVTPIGPAVKTRSPRDKQLAALRDELRALAAMLAKPAGAAQAEAAGKVKAMRPRLVESGPRLEQTDLFPDA